MTTSLDDHDLMTTTTPANPGAPKPRKCSHPKRARLSTTGSPRPEDPEAPIAHAMCALCGHNFYPAVSRRSRNNRKRGVSDELTVARILGGRKVGPLGHPWDVEIPGYLRAQSKKLSRWPSLNEVIAWLDAIPAGPELRAVTLADAPGHGKVRRLIVMDLSEFASFHGKEETR